MRLPQACLAPCTSVSGRSAGRTPSIVSTVVRAWSRKAASPSPQKAPATTETRHGSVSGKDWRWQKRNESNLQRNTRVFSKKKLMTTTQNLTKFWTSKLTFNHWRSTSVISTRGRYSEVEWISSFRYRLARLLTTHLTKHAKPNEATPEKKPIALNWTIGNVQKVYDGMDAEKTNRRLNRAQQGRITHQGHSRRKNLHTTSHTSLTASSHNFVTMETTLLRSDKPSQLLFTTRLPCFKTLVHDYRINCAHSKDSF